MVDGRQVQRVSGDEQKTTCDALFMSSTVSTKLLLIANYGDAFTTLPAIGASEGAVRRDIACSFSQSSSTFPMFGDIAIPGGLDAGSNNNFSPTMLRAVDQV